MKVNASEQLAEFFNAEAGVLDDLDSHFYFTHVGSFDRVVDSGEILLDGIFDVIYCLGLRVALRPAPR
jgi:hypothetical protein